MSLYFWTIIFVICLFYTTKFRIVAVLIKIFFGWPPDLPDLERDFHFWHLCFFQMNLLVSEGRAQRTGVFFQCAWFAVEYRDLDLSQQYRLYMVFQYFITDCLCCHSDSSMTLGEPSVFHDFKCICQKSGLNWIQINLILKVRHVLWTITDCAKIEKNYMLLLSYYFNSNFLFLSLCAKAFNGRKKNNFDR